MTRLSLDDFIDAFSAKLVAEGYHEIKLNDPIVRDGLFGVYRFLESSLQRHFANEDREWRRSLVNIRNLLQPSAIGSFDRFEALMRAKQTYLTDHPNPYYQDILIRMSESTAKRVLDRLPSLASELVTGAVQRYLAANAHASYRAEEPA